MQCTIYVQSSDRVDISNALQQRLLSKTGIGELYDSSMACHTILDTDTKKQDAAVSPTRIKPAVILSSDDALTLLFMEHCRGSFEPISCFTVVTWSLNTLIYSSGSWDVRALNPGGDQRLLPYKCNQWRSPDVSLLRVFLGLTFCKKKKKNSLIIDQSVSFCIISCYM